MASGANHLYEFGPYQMDPGRSQLLRGGEPVALTQKAFETLLILVEHSGHELSKDELMKKLWPGTFVEEANLAKHISMVRKALGETAQDRRYIVTLSGRGYRFAEPVRIVHMGGERSGEGQTRLNRGIQGQGLRPATEALQPEITRQPCGEFTGQSRDFRHPILVTLRDRLWSRKAAVSAAAALALILAGTIYLVRSHLPSVAVARDVQVEPEKMIEQVQDGLTPQSRVLPTVAGTVEPQAHDAYLRGQFFLYWDQEGHKQKSSKQSLQRAIDYFRQAIERDPGYALAYVGLADAYIGLEAPDRGDTAPKDTLRKAKAAASKALALDPSLGEAHFSLARVAELYDRNWMEADREYQLALRFGPSSAITHLEYGRYLQAMGRDKEAMVQVNQAVALDPLDYKIKDIAAYVTWASRQYDLALNEFQQLDDDFGLEWAYRQKHMYPEAIAAGRRALSRSPQESLYLASLACVYGLAGSRVEALKLIAELERRACEDYVSGSLLADAYVGLGEKDQALTWLERAYEEHDEGMIYIKANPGFDALRSEARFQALVQRMNFPQ